MLIVLVWREGKAVSSSAQLDDVFSKTVVRVALRREVLMSYDNITVKKMNGLSLPTEVGQLRYEQFIAEQNKPYLNADHNRKILFDSVDPLSTHIVCESKENGILSALRITPIEAAVELDYFDNVFSRIDRIEEYSIVLSRLVRGSGLISAKSIIILFKYSYDYCVERGWQFGLINTSPKLESLFIKYGWKRVGDIYIDEYAGEQVPMCLDSTDTKHLKSINSPYLKQGVVT